MITPRKEFVTKETCYEIRARETDGEKENFVIADTIGASCRPMIEQHAQFIHIQSVGSSFDKQLNNDEMIRTERFPLQTGVLFSDQ